MSNETGPVSVTNPTTIKEWALILLIAGVAVTFVVFAIGLAIAISSGEAIVSFTGEIDLGQFTGIIIGIAITSTVLVAQQLTQKNTINAIKENDETWIRTESNNTDSTKSN